MIKQHQSCIVGIDFGTTNTCVSYTSSASSDRNAIIVQNLDGDYTTPTCVYFSSDSKDILFGKEALRNKGAISNFKRLVGIKYSNYCQDKELQSYFCKKGIKVVQDLDSDYCAVETIYNGDTCVFSIYEITRLFFQHVSEFTNWAVDFDIKGAIVTVPAHFTDTARQIVKGACESVGLPVLRMLNEPTAAALCYGRDSFNPSDSSLTREENETVLVFDCGGGTTDISVVSMDYKNRVFEVVRTVGERFLGGEDLTQLLVESVIGDLKRKGHKVTQNDMSILMKACENAKRNLSFQYTSHLYLKDDFPIIPVSRSRFLSDANPFFEKISTMVKEVVLGISKIDRIVFVGGSSRIGYIKEKILKVLGDKAQNAHKTDIDPDHSVSTGASYYGEIINASSVDTEGDDDVLLVDVLSQTIGVETNGGFMTPIISKNTTLPVSKTTIFTNSEDNVDKIEIDIYQGERKFVKDNSHLGHFTLSGLDKSYAMGEMRIEVTIDINTDGIMSVTARETGADQKSGITIGVSQFQDVNLHDTSDTHSNDSDHLFEDSKRTNLVLAKLELENVVKRNKRILETTEIDRTDNNVLEPIDHLIRRTESILTFFEEHTPEFLKNAALDFMDEFHKIMSGTT